MQWFNALCLLIATLVGGDILSASQPGASIMTHTDSASSISSAPDLAPLLEERERNEWSIADADFSNEEPAWQDRERLLPAELNISITPAPYEPSSILEFPSLIGGLSTLYNEMEFYFLLLIYFILSLSLLLHFSARLEEREIIVARE